MSIPEVTLLFVIGLLVLGPERLPRAVSGIGRCVGRARRTANRLRYRLERELALIDVERSERERSDVDQTRAASSEDQREDA